MIQAACALHERALHLRLSLAPRTDQEPEGSEDHDHTCQGNDRTAAYNAGKQTRNQVAQGHE